MGGGEKKREVGGGEKKRSGTYDFFVGLRRSAFFWRLAAPLVIDYARFLTKINALDTQLEKELEKAQHGGGDEGLEADVRSLRGRMRAGFRRGPGAAADGRRVGREWTRAINEVRAKASHRLAEKWAPHLRDSFVKLGGLYIKVGQHLPAFPMTPLPYVDALAPLKDGVAPRGRDVIEPLILKNLSNGTKATSLAALGIKRVEWSKCLGAASVGQVHEAILADGRKAAIKVQYPEVRRNFKTDVACFTRVLCLVARTQGFVIEKKWIDEATRTFTRELDFADEAKNLRDLRAAVEAWPERARARAGRCLVPAPIENLVAGGVLVMELVPGRPLAACVREEREAIAAVVGCSPDDLERTFRDAQRKVIDEIRSGLDDGRDDDGASAGDEAAAPPPAAGALRRLADWLAYAADRGGDFLPLLKAFLAMQRVRLAAKIRRWSPWSASSPAAAAAFDARLVVDRLVYAVGRCILLDGIFSADPHPGNVLVRENNELGLIDMGCVYRLADGERRDVALALLAIGAGDADALGTLYARITGLELRTFDARVYAAVAVFALSHFDFSPVFPGEPLIKTLQRPEFKPKRAIQCQWLPLVQRCTEILRGDCLELGIRIRLCDAWRDLALECLATTTDGDDAHRTWPGGRDKRSELYRGDNPSVPAGLGGDAAPRAKPWRPWRRRRATRAAVDEEVKEEDPHHIEEKVLF